MAHQQKDAQFWASSFLEPKRQYRFILHFGPFEQWIVKKVARPSWSISNAEHNYINHTFNYPGRITWEPISLTLVDPLSPDTTGILMKMLMASGYRFPTDQTGTRTVSKAEAVHATNNVQIHMLGAGPPDGDSSEAEIIETWTLHNPWVESTSMGELDYTADDLIELEVTMRYDWASFTTVGTMNTSVDSVNQISSTLFGPSG